MIISTSKSLFNFLRYFFAVLIIFVSFLSPTLLIDKSFIDDAIAEKMPFEKRKKHGNLHLDEFKINKVENKKVYMSISGKYTYKTKVLIAKVRKTFKFSLDAIIIPKLNKHTLTFKAVDIRFTRLSSSKLFNKSLRNKHIIKPLKNYINKSKSTIKALKKIDDFFTIKNIEFTNEGHLLVNYKLTKLLYLLVLLFLIFEIKYLLLLPKKIIIGKNNSNS